MTLRIRPCDLVPCQFHLVEGFAQGKCCLVEVMELTKLSCFWFMIICFCPMLAYTWLNSLKINLYAPFLQKLNKVQTTSSWRYTSSSSSRGTFSEEAKKRYYQRMQLEYEEEQERVVSLHIFIIFFFLYSTINTSMVHYLQCTDGNLRLHVLLPHISSLYLHWDITFSPSVCWPFACLKFSAKNKAYARRF